MDACPLGRTLGIPTNHSVHVCSFAKMDLIAILFNYEIRKTAHQHSDINGARLL